MLLLSNNWLNLLSSAQLLSPWKQKVVHLLHVERVSRVLPVSRLVLNEVLESQKLSLHKLPFLPGFVEMSAEVKVLPERLQVDRRDAGDVVDVDGVEEAALDDLLKSSKVN